MNEGVSLPTAGVADAAKSDALEPRLLLEGVAKTWPKQDVPLFAHISLELQPGTLAVVTGRNGVGKTTLLRIVAGLISPDAGVVRLEGLSPGENRRDYHRRIGFLSAGSAGLYARLTVGQHLQYWGRLAMLPAAHVRSRVPATLELFELGAIADRRADRLSMGQRQRLRIALAFLHEPSLLVFDEPWSSLDGDALELLRAVTADFGAQGGCGLFSVPTGQELEVVSASADRIFVMENGGLRPL